MLDFITKKRPFHRSTWIKQLLAHPHHKWIKENKHLEASFIFLFERIPSKTLENLSKRGELLFLPSTGRWASSYVHQGMAILIYPEVINLLKRADPGIGLAILAHEMGHLVHRHHQKNIDVIEAQVEADDFAVQLGLGEYLAEFLESCQRSEEITIRITYVTSKIFAKRIS